MKLINKIIELTKIALHSYHIINQLQSIGLEVEPAGNNNIGDKLYEIITTTTNLIMDETGLKKTENADDIQEQLDKMLASHKNIKDLSEFEALYTNTDTKIALPSKPIQELVLMPVKHYNTTFLPMIDKAKGFINRFDLIIDHMDDEKVDHTEVRRLFDLYGLNDELKEFIIKALDYYKEHEGLDRLAEFSDVKLDLYNNLMYCPHCHKSIGMACDWTPYYCPECGKPLTGGNGRGDSKTNG